MFNRKPKIVNGWSVTTNPNKFDGNIMLGLGSHAKSAKTADIQKWDYKDRMVIYLTKDEARKLCETIMEYVNE